MLHIMSKCSDKSIEVQILAFQEIMTDRPTWTNQKTKKKKTQPEGSQGSYTSIKNLYLVFCECILQTLEKFRQYGYYFILAPSPTSRQAISTFDKPQKVFLGVKVRRRSTDQLSPQQTRNKKGKRANRICLINTVLFYKRIRTSKKAIYSHFL